MYGYLLATDYACLGIASALLLPLLIRCCHLHDTTLVLIGIAFKIVRLLVISFSSYTWLVYLSVVVGCPSALIISCVKSLISKCVGEDEIGKIFSLLSCAETLSNLVGSILFTSLYSATLNIYPGFTFTLDAILFAILFLILLWLAWDIRYSLGYNILEGRTLGGVGSTQNYGTTGARSQTSLTTSLTTTSLMASLPVVQLTTSSPVEATFPSVGGGNQ